MDIPDCFKLISSIGNDGTIACLKKHAKRLTSKDALIVKTNLFKKIEQTNQEIIRFGIPSRFHLAQVKEIQGGIFLKPSSAPIEIGDFIGIYTGAYELVEENYTKETAYAYDLLQGLKLTAKEKSHIKDKRRSYPKNQEFAIQTNALKQGNFTRFINHSSLAPNVEAVISKMPDGKMEILLFALQRILPGDQLLSNYGGQYWATLKIIPHDLTPASYTLDSSLQVQKHSLPRKPSAAIQEYLMGHRNPEVTAEKTLERSFSKTLPSLPKSLQSQVEAFEEIVLERAIPRCFRIKHIPRSWDVLLTPHSEPIQKGEFIGLLSGDLCIKTRPRSRYIFPLRCLSKDKLLCLDASHKGCFTREIPKNAKHGNVICRLYYDKKEAKTFVLLFAKEEILPGKRLVLHLPPP